MEIIVMGSGSIGARHVRLLQQMDPRHRITLLRHDAGQPTNPWGLDEVFAMSAALDAQPDLAVIASPTALHIEQAIACAEAGCDLFIEKPLGTDLTAAQSLIDIVDDREVITHVGCQLRFDPLIRRVATVLEEDTIGSVVAFAARAGSYLPEWRPGEDYRDSYSASAALGGGVSLDLIHEFDLLHWLVGPYAVCGSATAAAPHLAIETEAVAAATLRADSGAVGQVLVDYCRRRPIRQLELTGTEGSITADLIGGRIRVERGDRLDEEEIRAERDDRFRAQWEYVFDRLADRRPSMNDVATARDVLAAALEVRGDA